MNSHAIASEERHPSVLVAEMIEIHGRWVMIRALFRGLVLHRRAACYLAAGLSDHIRRDIGLERPPPDRRHWDFL